MFSWECDLSHDQEDGKPGVLFGVHCPASAKGGNPVCTDEEGAVLCAGE